MIQVNIVEITASPREGLRDSDTWAQNHNFIGEVPVAPHQVGSHMLCDLADISRLHCWFRLGLPGPWPGQKIATDMGVRVELVQNKIS